MRIEMMWMVAVALAPKNDCGADKVSASAGSASIATAQLANTAVAPLPLDAAVEPVAPTEPPVEVTSAKLFADYSSNEVSADDKYKGKPIRITGIVKKVSKDVRDKPYIQLLTGDRFEINDVFAFSDDPVWISKLKKGEKVVMLCTGYGLSLTVPIVEACTVEHVFELVRQ